jgi:hypothetical protein
VSSTQFDNPHRDSLPGPDRKILDDIEEYGWHAVNVAQLVDEEDEWWRAVPNFAYSIGLLHTYRHPELVVFGTDEKTRHDLLWDLARPIAGGQRFDAGTRSDVLPSIELPVQFAPVAREWHELFFGLASWFYLGTFSVLQAIWPDSAGCFPWDEGFPEAFREQQLGLDEPPRLEWW